MQLFRLWTTFLLITGLSAAVPVASSPTGGHPLDGPDIDLRVHVEAKRIEIQGILNLAFIDEIGSFARLNDDFVEPNEIPAFKKALGRTVLEGTQLRVDGDLREVDEIAVRETDWDPGDAEFFPRMGMKAVVRFRVSLVYRLDEEPRRIALAWKHYPRDLAIADLADRKLEVKAEWSAGSEVKIIELSEQEPEFIWHASAESFARPRPRPEPVPVTAERRDLVESLMLGLGITTLLLLFALLLFRARPFWPLLLGSLVLLVSCTFILQRSRPGESGPGPVASAELAEVFGERLKGIYDAFSFRQEEDIYDALAQSVSDEMIGPIYDRVYQSLVMQEEGGAVGRVKDFRTIMIEVDERAPTAREASVEARWQVAGEVFHWGHSHERKNSYHARYGMKWTPRGWLIDSVETLGQERLEIEGSEENR